MKVSELKEPVLEILRDLRYSQQYVRVFAKHWENMEDFLIQTYGSSEFSLERGLDWLEKTLDFSRRAEEKSLTPELTTAYRAVQFLEDYKLTGTINRNRTPNKMYLTDPALDAVFQEFVEFNENSDFSKQTKRHRRKQSWNFLDYLQQKRKLPEEIDLELINEFIKFSYSSYKPKTIARYISDLKFFISYLQDRNILQVDLASKIICPKMIQGVKVPDAWDKEEVKALLGAINRNNPLGKRDYAMILLGAIDAVRGCDVRHLTTHDIDWVKAEARFIQSKTGKVNVVPLPKPVLHAIADYIKNGRPKYFESDVIFITHQAPFKPLEENIDDRLDYYCNKAGIRKGKKIGFHGLRHTCATMMLEEGVSLPVISNLLGHSSVDVTGIYLKTDLPNLRKCVMPIAEELEDDTV